MPGSMFSASFASELVKSTGSTTPRKLSDRFAESASAKDSGATGDGVANDTTFVQDAINRPTAGGIVQLPSGSYLIQSQLSLRDYITVLGGTEQAVKLLWAGTSGRCIDYQSVVHAGTLLNGLTIVGRTGNTDHILEWRNNPLVTSSASGFSLRDFRITGAPLGKAAFHILGVKPSGGEGNVYGLNAWNAQFDSNLGHGIWVDAQSSIGAAGGTLLNFFSSSAAGNQGYGVFFDSSGAPSSKHGLVNMFGMLLQGNSQAAIRAASVGPMNLIGSYFEQTNGQPVLSCAEAPFPNGPFVILGNNMGHTASPVPNYDIDFGDDLVWGAQIVESRMNQFGAVAPGIAYYRISRLNGGIIGPDAIQAAANYVDWATAYAWRMVQVWDNAAGTWSFSSDDRFSEQPKIGFGVTNPNIAAYVDIAGHQPDPVATNGADAFDALRARGPKGGNTTGTTGQTAGRGGDVLLTAGAGGNAPSGSTNGAGGDVLLAAGATGSGAGTPGTPGQVQVGATGNRVGFFGTAGVAKPTISGSRGGNAAVASLLTQLAALGLIVDETTA